MRTLLTLLIEEEGQTLTTGETSGNKGARGADLPRDSASPPGLGLWRSLARSKRVQNSFPPHHKVMGLTWLV